MIERLNFYDIYGYLLPGAALLSVMYLPFLMTGAKAPPLEWTSAILSLVIAYAAGHLLQILVRPVFTEEPYPSDTLITELGKKGLPDSFKHQLRLLLRDDFQLDVRATSDRLVAFEACRYAVQSKEVSSYAEQFQGLYALMRGLASASLLGAASQFGWIVAKLSVDHPRIAPSLLWGTLFVFFGWAIRDRVWFWIAAAGATWAGLVAARPRVYQVDLELFILCGVALMGSSRLFYTQFRRFQGNFARAVYVNYFARRKSPLTYKPSHD